MNRSTRRARRWLRAVGLLGDLAVALGGFYLAFWIRLHYDLPFTQSLLPRDRLELFASDWFTVVAITVPLLYFFSFYDPPRPRPRLDLVRGLTVVVGLQGLLLAGAYFLLLRPFPRTVLLLFMALELPLLVGWRFLLQRWVRVPSRRVAVVGGGPAAEELAKTIETHHWHGLTVAGFVRPPGEEDPLPGRELGNVDDLPGLLASGEVDDVILVPSRQEWRSRLLDRWAMNRPAHANLLMLPGPFESLIGRMRYRWVHDLPMIEVVGEADRSRILPWKRALDLTAGSLLLLLALPLIAAVALAVRVTSPGPVLYRQERVGRDRQPFVLLKFRTMKQDAERDTGEILASPGDPRLTPIGATLRRYRLDELPQLFNVLAGSMSLVGPRPERPGFVACYLAEVPGYAERFSLAPGLTGLAQVNGEYHSSARNKLRYDLAYQANQSLWLDLSILVRTVKIVLSSRGT